MKFRQSINRSAYVQIIQEWDSCIQCSIGSWAYRHVFGKGSLHPTIMFIGEAPGKSEDVMGRPFTGVSGHLLHHAIGEAGGIKFRTFFTNLVCCRPTDSEGGNNRPPSQSEISNCKIRLYRTIFLLNPKIIVLLGRVPQQILMADTDLYK